MLTLEVTHPIGVVRKAGNGSFSASAGQSVKIEISPEGEEVMDVEVPTGKEWTVNISVNVIETDA